MKSSPKLVVIGLFSTIAYIALAVAGWGGPRHFFSHPPLVVLVAGAIAMSIVALFTEGNVSSGVREDRSNRWVIFVLLAIGFISSYVPAYTDRIGFWTIDGNTVRWIGVALFLAGGALRLWPVFVLRNRFSGLVAIQPEHTLVTNGIYGVIRHPSYMGLLIGSLGWCLAFRSIVGLILTALLIPPIIARIRSEEALLQSHFGEEYDAYRKRTSRLIPGIY